MDECNEQATRAWGTKYKPPTLTKPKGKILRRSMLCTTIAFHEIKGQPPKAFIHWTLVPPRKSRKPLDERIQSFEVEKGEKRELKSKYTPEHVASWSSRGLKAELKDLGITSPEKTVASMRDVLLRVGRTGTRVGELRAKVQGE